MALSLTSLPRCPQLLSTNRVWRAYQGGRTLDELENQPAPQDGHYPEDWLASDVEAVNPSEMSTAGEGLSRININGESHLLRDLYCDDPLFFFGEEHLNRFGPTPSFLVKFIDSATRLHLQVHPTQTFSRTHLHSPYGKFEAYYVLSVRPDQPEGNVYLGFQRPPSRQQLRGMIEEQKIDDLLNCFDPVAVQAGDVVVVPGGMPHALGGGVLLVEILEPSDWVVRFEFSRGGLQLPIKDRYMGHDLDFCLGVFNLQPHTKEHISRHNFCSPQLILEQGPSKRYRLIGPQQTQCFSVWKSTFQGKVTRSVESFAVGIVLGDTCTVYGPEGAPLELRPNDRFIIPHGQESLSLECAGQGEILECYSPGARPEEEQWIAS